MRSIKLLFATIILLILSSQFALAVCPEGSNWTSTWTDPLGQTTYTLEAPCKVYLTVPFDIKATVTDNTHTDSFVAASWAIVDNGTTIQGGDASWLSVSAGVWELIYEQTYTGIAIDHTIEFSFTDMGNGAGAHNYASNVIGDLTVDPYPPGDFDSDGLDNNSDNCPFIANVDQIDTDADGAGDPCDVCALPPNCPTCGEAYYNDLLDANVDGTADCQQTDTDSDGVMDGQDQCEGYDDTVDADADGIPDGCDIPSPSDLDPSFGSGGIVTTDLGSNYDKIHDLVMQDDGKIVASGYFYNSSGGVEDFAVARYDVDGSLDNSFAGVGFVKTAVSAYQDIGNAIKLQPDGKLVQVGFSRNVNDYDVAMVRYNSTGELDSSFAGDGIVTSDLGNQNETGKDIAVLPNGQILVAVGGNGATTYNSFDVARYNPDGSLDDGFGISGKVSTLFGGLSAEVNSIVLQDDGKFLLVGSGYIDSSTDFILARYNVDGSLDSSFGDGGVLVFDFGGTHDTAESVRIQADGKIIVVGYSTSVLDFLMARFNSDGSVDTGFGSEGRVLTDFSGMTDRAYDLAIQSDGKIIVVGSTVIADPVSDGFAIARYNTDGSLDSEFGIGGKMSLSFGGGALAQSVSIQPNGKIVVAGYTSPMTGPNDKDFALIRLVGEPDTDADSIPDYLDDDDDNDGVSDVDEIALGTDPLFANAFVPRTGQKTCYDASGNAIDCEGTGQDGEIQAGLEWPDPRFTDNGDGTVTDSLTGLTWAKDVSTPTIGACTGGSNTWQGALDYVACLNDNFYLGFTDWVLPNISELDSLVDVSQYFPAVPSGHPFATVQPATYWSSSTYFGNPDNAFTVYMVNGALGIGNKISNYYVWPVRREKSSPAIALPKTGQTNSYAIGDDGDLETGRPWPAQRYSNNSNGTVTDNLTGLTWLKDANCLGLQSWEVALNSANSLSDGICGLNDGSAGGSWRLPNIRELKSLLDFGKSYPALAAGHPFTNVQTGNYWSSSSSVSDAGFALGVVMSSGGTNALPMSDSYYVWPVRGGLVDITPPEVPSNIEVNDLGVDGEVMISWSNPSDADFDHVVIYRSTVQGELGSVLADNVAGLSYVDDTVGQYSTYYYTVRAVDAVGNESNNTSQVSVSTGNFAPSAPGSIAAAGNGISGEIEVTWENGWEADLSCINIYRSTVSGSLGSLVGNCVTGTLWTDTALENGKTYYYTVKAKDNGGKLSTNTSQVSATPINAAASDAPDGVSGVNSSDDGEGGSVTISWTNPEQGSNGGASDDLAYVLIYKRYGSEYFIEDGVSASATSPASTGSWTDYDVQGCTTYYYNIVTLDADGNEGAGVNVSHFVQDNSAPLPVTGLEATLLAGYDVRLDWNQSGDYDASGYQVYYNSGAGLTSLDILTHPASGYNVTTLPESSDEYDFVVRTLAGCSNPPTSLDSKVTVTTVADPDLVNICTAQVKAPQTGHKISGNSVSIKANINCTGTAVPADITGVEFFYSDDAFIWHSISPTLSGELNPDAVTPYQVHWNTATLPQGEYFLRAETNLDPSPGYIAVVIDHGKPDVVENNNGGKQSKQEPAYANAPSTTTMADGDGFVTVDIPSGALPVNDIVTITEINPGDATPPPVNYKKTNKLHDISFINCSTGSFGNNVGGGPGLLNGKKAKVTLSYPDVDNDGFVDGVDPPLNVYDLEVCNDHNNTWKCLSSLIDIDNKTVQALISECSPFSLMAPPRLSGNGLTMVTVPMYPSPNSTSSVLGPINQYGGYAPVWNPATNNWITRPGSVVPGKSYFIWANGKAIIVSGTEVPQSNFNIKLYKGWNMMGNPFRYEVPLSDIQVNCGSTTESLQTAEDNGWVVGTFFHYVNGAWQTWSVQEGDNLPTWKGLYVLSDKTCTMTIPPTPAQ